MEYQRIELLIFMLFYGFVGWSVEVVITTIRTRRFSNRGFFNLPICPKYGIMADILLVILPTIPESLSLLNVFTQYMITLVVVAVVDSITNEAAHRILHRRLWQYERENLFGGELKGTTVALLKPAVILVVIKLIHPFVYMVECMIPLLVLRIVGFGLLGMLAVDMITVIYAGQKMRIGDQRGDGGKAEGESGDLTDKLSAALAAQTEMATELAMKTYSEVASTISEENLGNRLCRSVWERLERAYPGMEKETDARAKYVFAKGLCLNKLIWIFVIWAFLGDLFEMVFVWTTTGVWMSRSSVIYGTFSVVWGFGAVIISIVTQRLANREDRYVFLAGCFLWGVYEYSCSVISEVVFGRTFWDYSDMMFNLDGRTNLLFCLFGGLLSVMWVKALYPLVSRGIEAIPPAIGMVTTWAVIIVMIADLALSGAVLARYVDRVEGIPAGNPFEDFIDETYSDEYIVSVWPNMRLPGSDVALRERQEADE